VQKRRGQYCRYVRIGSSPGTIRYLPGPTHWHLPKTHHPSSSLFSSSLLINGINRQAFTNLFILISHQNVNGNLPKLPKSTNFGGFLDLFFSKMPVEAIKKCKTSKATGWFFVSYYRVIQLFLRVGDRWFFRCKLYIVGGIVR
jgi:hypothetical protein